MLVVHREDRCGGRGIEKWLEHAVAHAHVVSVRLVRHLRLAGLEAHDDAYIHARARCESTALGLAAVRLGRTVIEALAACSIVLACERGAGAASDAVAIGDGPAASVTRLGRAPAEMSMTPGMRPRLKIWLHSVGVGIRANLHSTICSTGIARVAARAAGSRDRGDTRTNLGRPEIRREFSREPTHALNERTVRKKNAAQAVVDVGCPYTPL